MTLGALVAFLQYSQRFFRPISDLSEKFNILQAAMASSERIFGLLDTPVVITSPAPGRARYPDGPGRITFEQVWFAYRDEDYVLRDVSFTVEPGERVGIVGATGAGKTTLINLLLRFYEVNRGRIAIDGVDIHELTLPELRRRFGLVLQDVFLFSGTIRDNVALGNPEITDAQVRAAVKYVHADRFIERLPAGLDSEVAERGGTLSVGQKQLLSFARALAFAPEVLILDEATSSVDTETEVLVRDALRILMADGRRWPSRTASRRCRTWTGFSFCTKGSCARWGHTRSSWRSAGSTTRSTSCSTRIRKPPRCRLPPRSPSERPHVTPRRNGSDLREVLEPRRQRFRLAVPFQYQR